MLYIFILNSINYLFGVATQSGTRCVHESWWGVEYHWLSNRCQLGVSVENDRHQSALAGLAVATRIISHADSPCATHLILARQFARLEPLDNAIGGCLC